MGVGATKASLELAEAGRAGRQLAVVWAIRDHVFAGRCGQGLIRRISGAICLFESALKTVRFSDAIDHTRGVVLAYTSGPC